MKPLYLTLIAATSLLLIGVGCWLAWPPAGLFVPGALVWLDLSIAGRKRAEA